MTSYIDRPNFFGEGRKLTEPKPFFHGISPQHAMYIWENVKKE